ncbi:MAG: hypothetical protein RR908_03240 [Rikenellaceae bacterium]
MLVIAMMAFFTEASFAQLSDKELKKDLKERVDKDARKEAKTLTKEGWKVMPGKLSIERQIQDAQYAALDIDENGEKLNFIGTHQAIGGNYSSAKQIADNRAHIEIANAIGKAITGKAQDQVSNRNLGDNDIELIDEYVSGNKSVVSSVLHGITPVLEIYRQLPDGKYEVMVTVSVNAHKALRDAKIALQAELKDKSQNIIDHLDKIL